MRRIIQFLVLCILVTSLCACGRFGSPISTTRPIPSYEPNSGISHDPNATEDPTSEQETDPTEDTRDEPEVIRQEIANMLRDAEDLIAEGLYDDARMVLRDLRSRDLTETESKKVNALLARLVSISD